MINLTIINPSSTLIYKHAGRPRKGPHILRLSKRQLSSRLNNLKHRKLSSFFENIKKFPGRSQIVKKLKRLKIDTLKTDEEALGRLSSITPESLKQFTNLTDMAVSLARTLGLKSLHLPGSRTLYIFAEERNLEHFKALSMISPAEQHEMRREREAQVLFYYLANAYLGGV